jgi:hypothetical protein
MRLTKKLQRALMRLPVYTFKYKFDDQHEYIGWLAQDIEAVAPWAIRYGSDGLRRVHFDWLGLQTFRRKLPDGPWHPVTQAIFDRVEAQAAAYVANGGRF